MPFLHTMGEPEVLEEIDIPALRSTVPEAAAHSRLKESVEDSIMVPSVALDSRIDLIPGPWWSTFRI